MCSSNVMLIDTTIATNTTINSTITIATNTTII